MHTLRRFPSHMQSHVGTADTYPRMERAPMAKGIRFYETGGPDVLQWQSIDVGTPGAGEVRIRPGAGGLNFGAPYFRTGLYPSALPAGMGVEAAGVIEEIGPGVTGFA